MRKNNMNTKANKVTNQATSNKAKEIMKTTNVGDVSELRGLLAAAKASGKDVVLIRIPARLFAIDTRYQTPIRTERNLSYLINNFDEAKLLPLTGVPHEDEGLVYLVDGYGRWKATQFINEVKYEYLDVMLILKAPKDPEERLKYEAEQYAFQNKNVAKMTPLQKHGALKILGDEAVIALDELKDIYGFEYTYGTGQRRENVLGSYSEALDICKSKGKDCMDYVLSICQKAGFDRKTNGYAVAVIRAFKDIYTLYANDRNATREFLGKYLRQYDPNTFKSFAVTKYPTLDYKGAVTLYTEDLVVEGLGLKQSREVVSDKLVFIKTA